MSIRIPTDNDRMMYPCIGEHRDAISLTTPIDEFATIIGAVLSCRACCVRGSDSGISRTDALSTLALILLVASVSYSVECRSLYSGCLSALFSCGLLRRLLPRYWCLSLMMTLEPMILLKNFWLIGKTLGDSSTCFASAHECEAVFFARKSFGVFNLK